MCDPIDFVNLITKAIGTTFLIFSVDHLLINIFEKFKFGYLDNEKNLYFVYVF